jgi:hypothetical protein
MIITLINPRWTFAKNDFIGSGIPYWPTSMAAMVWLLRRYDCQTKVVDLPALNIEKFEHGTNISFQGESPLSIDERVLVDSNAIVVYAQNYATIKELENTIQHVASKSKNPIYILENSQAVTGFKLNEYIRKDFISMGATDVLSGNPLVASQTLFDEMNYPRAIHTPLDEVKLHWEKYQFKSYNSLPYSHAPKRAPYIPLITSWGCPYGCDFCVAPSTTGRKWIGKKPETVVEELVEAYERFGALDFQVEDLNPTVKWVRWQEIAQKIVNLDIKVTYSIASGTKAETIPLDSIDLLYRSGCRFISISPESGSPKLLKFIGKHFDHEYALKLVSELARRGIATQACFLVGHPKETNLDKLHTIRYVIKMLWNGLSEIAVFTVAPYPGSSILKYIETEESDIYTFSGHGRQMKIVDKLQRITLVSIYLLALMLNPKRLMQVVSGSTFRTAKTKTENTFRRFNFLRSKMRL